MLVIDTSVWIDHFNNVDNAEVAVLRRALIEDTVLLGDIVLLELLQGFRTTERAAQAVHVLRHLPAVAMLSPALAPRAAAYYRQLRDVGITIRKTADLIIGTFCIAGGHTLLHRDRDFALMARHLPLVMAT